jgi:predicted O-linked N-acetylglucosamine transferase (SPINDLY family)
LHRRVPLRIKGPSNRGDGELASFSEALTQALRLLNAGRLDEAEALSKKLSKAAPLNADAAFLAGAVAQRRNRLDAAVTAYRRAIDLAPDYADAHNNLGNVLLAQGKTGAAIESLRRAASIEPGLAQLHYNLGNALASKSAAEAVESYRRAIALKPDYIEAYNNLGVQLRRLGQPEAAMATINRALAIKPDFAGALANLANALADLGRIEESVAASRRALALDPNNSGTHSDLIFNLNFDARAAMPEHQAERRRWAQSHADRYAPERPPLPRDPDPERRLRVGYVSAHFRAYAASYAFGGVLIHHDPKQFEVFCYSDTSAGDELTALFRARADHWRDTWGLSDESLAELIRRDGIDILVDLVGHMAGHRLLVFARRPAPVQITGWGEPTGTGLKTMDYLLADPVLVPAAERALLPEKVIDLPGALGFWTPEPLPEPGPLPAKTRGFVTFGSFNRRAKLTAESLACWGEILRALPGSRLTLKNKAFGEAAEQDLLRSALEAAGIDPARVGVLGQTGRSEHFEAYRGIDIALDPFPHGGGMTTLDALAMGVPVVTWPGRTISSRLAASCLTALGLERFIAQDAKSYAGLAISVARDLDALVKFRGELPRLLAASEIGDPKRYAVAVETAYREAWRRAIGSV